LGNNFLKECNIVAKYWTIKPIWKTLSDNGDDVVQTTKRPGCPKKGVKKITRAGQV